MDFANILDVGCGLGEYATLDKGNYFGLDNSFPCVKFASRKYKQHRFLMGNALQLPFGDNSFDATLLVSTAHHLADDEFHNVLCEMRRVSRKFIMIDEPIKTHKLK